MVDWYTAAPPPLLVATVFATPYLVVIAERDRRANHTTHLYNVNIGCRVAIY